MQHFDAAGLSASRWQWSTRLVIALALMIAASGIVPIALGPLSPQGKPVRLRWVAEPTK